MATRGFTLIEVLVAFVIVALSLAAMLEIFGTGFRALDTARDRFVEVRLLRSHLAAYSASAAEGEGEGTIDLGHGEVARIQAAAMDTGGLIADGDAPLVPVLVTVMVGRAGSTGSDLTISTIRLRHAR